MCKCTCYFTVRVWMWGAFLLVDFSPATEKCNFCLCASRLMCAWVSLVELWTKGLNLRVQGPADLSWTSSFFFFFFFFLSGSHVGVIEYYKQDCLKSGLDKAPGYGGKCLFRADAQLFSSVVSDSCVAPSEWYSTFVSLWKHDFRCFYEPIIPIVHCVFR